MDEKCLLLEEYKILEARYRADTSRIWSQAQILVAANLLTVTALSSMLMTSPNQERMIDLRCALFGVSVIGFAVSLTWFLSVATDNAYQNLSMKLLREMEQRLELPIKVFSQVHEAKGGFKPWAQIGGATALVILSFVFVIMWLVVGFAIWFIIL